jgi:sortase A
MDSLGTGETVVINDLPQAEYVFDPAEEEDVFDSEETAPPAEDTEELPLNCIGIMVIDKIDLRLPIVEGLTRRNLSYALAHLENSAAIGEAGDCCIFGHRNHTFGKFFNRLDELGEGDAITLEDAAGVVHNYTVVKKEILKPTDENLLVSGIEGSVITLITCHPIGVASHRLVIRAQEELP